MARAPQVRIDIAAVDQFSAMLAKLRRDLKASGDEAALVNQKASRIGMPSLGFAEAGKDLNAFHAQASRQIGSLSRILPGMGALGGIASVAGLGEIVTRYAGLGVELKNVAQVAGASAAGMDSMRGSARLLGLSAGVADQAMVGLNKSLADAYFGKNADAAAAFRQAGIGLQGIAGGAAKAEEKIGAISDFMQRLMKSDPRAAVTFADKIGIGSEAINLLGIGAERLAALRKEAAALSGITDDNQASAEKFAASMGRVGIAADRVGRTITTTLEPVVGPLLNEFADWTRDHAPEVQAGFKGIATGIGAAAIAIPPAIGRLREYGAEVTSLFDAIKRAGEAVGADKVGIWARDHWGQTHELTNRNGFDQAVFDKLNPTEREAYQGSPGERRRLNRQVAPDRYSEMGGAGGAGGAGSAVAAGPPGNPNDPRGIRNNNPLNLSYVPGQPGVIGSDGRFGKYADMEGGVAAAHRQLQRYQDRGLTNVGAMIGRWAPPNENDTAGYVRTVSRRMGVDPSAPVDLHDVNQSAAMIAAMARVETGRELDPDVVRRGVRRALNVAEQQSPAPEPAAEAPDLSRGGRLPQLMAPSAAATNPATPSNNNGQSAVRIHLTADNLPNGITPQISTQGDGAEVASVRLRYAMPQGG